MWEVMYHLPKSHPVVQIHCAFKLYIFIQKPSEAALDHSELIALIN